MNKKFHPTIYWVYDYLFMLEFKLNCVSKSAQQDYILSILWT